MVRYLSVLLAALTIQPGYAADFYSAKDGATVHQTFLPAGVYVSIGGGEVFSATSISTLALAGQGLAADARIGYDWRVPNTKFIVGPWAGIGIADVTGKNLSGREKWDWSAGLRAGRVFNTSDLLYGVVGYKQIHEGIVATPLNPALDGLVVGGGIEFDIANGVTLGTEIDYTWIGNYTPVAGVTFKSSEFDAKARVGFRL